MTYDDWKLSNPYDEQLENNIWTKCPLCKRHHWSHLRCGEVGKEYEYEDRLEDKTNDYNDC
jgi:hypothetical protein